MQWPTGHHTKSDLLPTLPKTKPGEQFVAGGAGKSASLLSLTLQSNVRHKSRGTKRLGCGKCPLSPIKGDRKKINRLDNLEKFHFLNIFWDVFHVQSHFRIPFAVT